MTSPPSPDLNSRLAALTPEKRALLEKSLLARRMVGVEKITPRDRTVATPLSSSQYRLWFFDQLDPGAPTYNAVLAMTIEGQVSVEYLEQAIRASIERHEVLRTAILLGADDEPKQTVLEDWTFQLEQLDAADEETAKLAVASKAREPFDLTSDLTLRALLVSLAPQRHLLAFIEHHIAFDGWSDEILCREVSAAYARLSRGERPEPERLPVQYADFAAWQNGRSNNEASQAHAEFWKKALRTAPPLLALPTDRPRPASQGFAGRHLQFRFDADLAEGARRLARDCGVTDFMLLSAVFYAAVYRWTGQSDLTFGTPSANRNQIEIEDLIGFFSNTLPLRVELDGSWAFIELVHAVRASALDAFEHSELPFHKIVDVVSPPRDPAYNPLFQINIRVQSDDASVLDLPGARCAPVHVDLGFSRFDLAVDFQISSGAINGYLEFNEGLFVEPTAQRVVDLVQGVLRAALADPQIALWDLPSMSSDGPGRARRSRVAR